MLRYEILNNGNLKFSIADKDAFDTMLLEALEKEIADKSYMNIEERHQEGHVPDPYQRDSLMCDVFEDVLSNSELRWVAPQEIGAMTDAPLIANFDPYPDQDPSFEDLLENPQRVWYYNFYCFRSPVVDLWRDGETIFNRA